MTDVLGVKHRFNTVLALIVIALPIYLIGCLGLRVIGVPAILRAIFSSRAEIWSAIRPCALRGDRPANRANMPHCASWIRTRL